MLYPNNLIPYDPITVKPVSKFSSVADNAKVTPGQGQANDSDAANDLNAAKVAAMKAAELGM